MRIKFKCKCGAKLRCSFHGIGSVLVCPECSGEVKVPTPGFAEVQRVLKAVPHAFPNKSAFEYLDLMQEIHAIAEYNVRVCRITKQPALAEHCVDQARRILRNIAVFLNDVEHDSARQQFCSKQIVNGLAMLAAGQRFGGEGTIDAALRRNQRWMNKQEKTESSEAQSESTLRERVFATVAAVESFLA